MNAHATIQSLNMRCKFIMDIIQSFAPISKNEILIKTKMKLTTLNRDMTTLLERKIIIESSLADSTGGRKAALYDVNPVGFYLVGIDVSRTYSQIVVTNLKFEIIIEKRIQDDLYDMNSVILSLPKELSSILEVGAIDISSIIGIGIGLVHDVDSHLLKENMQNEIGVPVSIDNGANTAVIGEYYLGMGKGKHNIAFINCGVGIRTGVIFSGNLIRTINNDKDALAHMIVEQNGNLCECGNHGCLETYVSINDLPMKYKQMMLSQTDSSINDISKDISYLDVCNLAESNNEIAKQIILQAAFYFGIALTNFIRLLNPQLVILSGPYIQNSPLFYEETKRIVLKNLSISLDEIKFSKGGYFESNSIAMGASAIAMRSLLEK